MTVSCVHGNVSVCVCVSQKGVWHHQHHTYILFLFLFSVTWYISHTSRRRRRRIRRQSAFKWFMMVGVEVGVCEGGPKHRLPRPLRRRKHCVILKNHMTTNEDPRLTSITSVLASTDLYNFCCCYCSCYDYVVMVALKTRFLHRKCNIHYILITFSVNK